MASERRRHQHRVFAPTPTPRVGQPNSATAPPRVPLNLGLGQGQGPGRRALVVAVGGIFFIFTWWPSGFPRGFPPVRSREPSRGWRNFFIAEQTVRGLAAGRTTLQRFGPEVGSVGVAQGAPVIEPLSHPHHQPSTLSLMSFLSPPPSFSSLFSPSPYHSFLSALDIFRSFYSTLPFVHSRLTLIVLPFFFCFPPSGFG